jgi:predicted dienelactone hydrolase
LLVSVGWGPHPYAHLSIGTRLASHGFVVVAPRHTGDQWLTTEPTGDHAAWALWNRPRDASFVLTTLLQRNATRGDRFYGLIAPNLVAAAGHSLGGYTAIALAGGDDTVWDYGLTDPYAWIDGSIPEDVPRGSTLPDPRFKVIVALDSANQELRFEELTRVKVPALGLGEEWDTLAMDPLMTGWQARQHAAFSGHPSYRVDVARTNHHSFAETCDGLAIMDLHGLETIYGTNDVLRSWLCEGVLTPAESRAIISRYMLAFLKTELLGETDYQRMLTPGWTLTRETGIEFFETEKRSPGSILGEWPDMSVYFWHQPGIQHSQANKNAKHNMASRFMPRFR